MSDTKIKVVLQGKITTELFTGPETSLTYALHMHAPPTEGLTVDTGDCDVTIKSVTYDVEREAYRCDVGRANFFPIHSKTEYEKALERWRDDGWDVSVVGEWPTSKSQAQAERALQQSWARADASLKRARRLGKW